MKTVKYFFLIQFVFLYQSSFGMMRRLGSRVAPASAPAASRLTHGKRLLLPGQEHNPAWIAANEEVEKFRASYNLPKVPDATIKVIENFQNEAFLKSLNHHRELLPKVSDDQAMLAIKDVVTKKAQELLALHSIDPKTISITFLPASIIQKATGEDFSMFVTGTGIFINQDLLRTKSSEEIQAELEHEIGHLVSHDAAHAQAYSFLEDLKYDKEYYKYLIEKRADTHSSIQSKQNVVSLMNLGETMSQQGLGLRYPMQLKLYQACDLILRIAPIMLESPETIELLSRTYQSPSVFEEIKRLSIKHYKAGKIEAKALQEIVAFCDRPTYLDDMLIFHDSQLPGFDKTILTGKKRPFWASAATGIHKSTEEKKMVQALALDEALPK